jgi:hypothetical protein
VAETHTQAPLVVYEVYVASSPSTELILPRGIFEELSNKPSDPRRDLIVDKVIAGIPADGVKRRHSRNRYVFGDLIWVLTTARITPEDRSALDD